MAKRIWLGAAMAAAVAVGAGHRYAEPSVAAAPQEHPTSTIADQTELALTVYNTDLALIRDVRNVNLARGTSDLRFMDIAATVNPATVHFRSLSDPSGVSVLEQNYEYDLLEPEKLLHKYVGRDADAREDAQCVDEEVTATFSATTARRSGASGARS